MKKSIQISIRLDSEDRENLERIIAWRADVLAEQGVEVKASNVMRWLIRQAADELTKHSSHLPKRSYEEEKRDLALAEQKSGEQILRVVESVQHFKMLEKKFGPKTSVGS